MDTLAVKTTSERILVGNQPTDIFLARYSDRILFIATQTGTVGSVFHVTAVTNSDREVEFNVKGLLGRRDEETLQLCVRRVAAKLCSLQSRKMLVLCFALRNLEVRDINVVVEAAEKQCRNNEE